MSGAVHPLRDNQARAVAPERSVWLSASAGTGKTQVLSARVLRLLLQPGVKPGQILCLTFTKAGAAEMSERVNAVLARWVRLKPEELGKNLLAIGAPVDPATQERARTRFAAVLDCPGGGLRIDTIHAFSQWLLAAFPDEAGLVAGTRPMEDRDRELLARQVLQTLVVEAEQVEDVAVLGPLAMLSERMGPDGVRLWLMRCAEAREVWQGTGAWQPPMHERVLRLLGLESDASETSLVELCAEGVFDCEALHRVQSANAAWGTATALKSTTAIADFLGASGLGRVTAAGPLRDALFTQKGEIRSLKSLEKCDPGYAAAAEAVAASLGALRERQALLALADLLTPALELGRRFALAWEEAKEREGLIDFDDQIRRAAELLTRSDIADWIRYKLDRRFDHILIDEAQDTNQAQWDIIRALTGDFFAGEGARGEAMRTIFVVGDYKQAIFRFQGTSPENFAIARQHYAELIDALAAGDPDRELLKLGLGRSYRTAQPVLDFVDRAIETIGARAFGLDSEPEPHIGDGRPGLVTLWHPVAGRGDDADDDGPEDWLSEPEGAMANRIADQVRVWLRDGFPLVKGGTRNAGPGDIMVLVRKRRELAGLIVARLHAAGVPVAGVDRLRLGAPLGVKDLLAALRFSAQPLDSLSLANLLVSPLIGWSQEELLKFGYRTKGVPLWDHIRGGAHPRQQETAARLLDLLWRADFEPPQALLHWLLVGPWQGRKALVARLGHEVHDPIDELLNAASAYASTQTPSLVGFLAWFDAGEGELKRDADGGGGLVRVMTVHGSKGLQAPIVILADATGNPDASPTRDLTLTEDLPGGGGRTVPMPPLRKEEKAGPVVDAENTARVAERQEHWRLLYVAMTRAEEALFIGGALGKREKEPAPDSWFARLAPLFENEPLADPIWGAVSEWGARAPAAPPTAAVEAPLEAGLPVWASAPVGDEPRPPRPLAPSAAGAEQGADPPFPADTARIAARRGVLVHRLLERLPDIAPNQRSELGRGWLTRQAADLPAEEREALLASALAVLSQPAFADVFSPSALAEVPLAATVGGVVVAGTADRLLIEPGRITVVDFKTTRRPPSSLEEVPESTLRQMAAYVAALQVIYPGREICAAVLYTQAPRLIVIPEDLLAARKTHLSPEPESFPAPSVE
ncbi:double-strand break repair helicase AddA [Altererythrobacter sp. TH136]|uniref:double-strand break repair helicase AddA n=1 Tax=Altererythrobacter sp. TH136 TaxID=2067415 RepID=UPI0011620D23|nr:double-strand break repair helicase AddA [Altererythrobacter sp. TH136]QDM40167.1 double-strand break repair helicase AddA [Altererythrobacter sp. TH136]